MSSNPFVLIVPCHRVILSSGKFGKYSGGKRDRVKEWLLHFEQHNKKKEKLSAF
jgi:methylated-DNA-[protein]-cysteine S-methyltransferase